MISSESFCPVDHETCTVPGSGTVSPTLSNANPDRGLRCAGIFVGGAGNLVCTLENGQGGAATYAVTAGQVLLGRIKSVDHTTTATGLVFLYLGL